MDTVAIFPRIVNVSTDPSVTMAEPNVSHNLSRMAVVSASLKIRLFTDLMCLKPGRVSCDRSRTPIKPRIIGELIGFTDI